METIEVQIQRNNYSAQTTIGGLYFPEDNYKERLCYTLEDTVRAEGIKVHGETALPGSCEGIIYNLGIRRSPSFKRDCIVIYSRKEGEKYYAEYKDVSFLYSMLHGGNRHKDSHGCPLVAYNKLDDDTIQGTAEKEVFNKIKTYMDRGFKVVLRIVNNPQSN